MPTLNWIGKQAVEKHHLEIPYKLLEYDESLSTGDQESGNLLIQGDNLHALKALLPYYAGKVKCIYIDPPYNTGNEKWRYNDNVNAPEIKEWLDDFVGKEDEDFSRHDKWLCLMYPRLQLLKKLLKQDGAIFISIDDTEQAHLRLLLDEIFGMQNFVGNIIWQKKFSPQNDAKYFSDNHDFILCYARNRNKWRRNLLTRTEKMDARYKNPDDDARGDWTSGDLSVKTYNASTDYPITTPSGRVVNPPKGYCWRVNQERLAELIKDNRIWFGESGNNVPRLKRFKSDVQEGIVPLTIWLHSEVGHNQQASQELKQIFPEASFPFETPKPSSLIKRILQIASSKDSLILDSFSGSGTTGQAVLEINKEDNGNRKFILVELENEIARKVTSERLKRVINGYTVEKSNGNNVNIEGLGSGFKYCNLSEPLFDRYGNVREGVKFKELARHIFFSETGSPISDKAKLNTPKIGTYKGTSYYLLFNGILGDKTVNGGNVLTSKVLEKLPKYNGPKIIFGEANRLGSERLKKENIIFKQIPYEIKTS
jgi:adenine specific DNA methylase Mod